MCVCVYVCVCVCTCLFCPPPLPPSDSSQDAFDLYYSESYSESSSLSLQDSQRSLASLHSDGESSNPGLLLMQEYMITVGPPLGLSL